MNLKFHLVAYSRSTDELLSKRRLRLDEEQVREALGFPPHTDLSGSFPIDRLLARRLRGQGAVLDLRKGDYFVESEADYDEVMESIRERRQSAKSSRGMPASKPAFHQVGWTRTSTSFGRFASAKGASALVLSAAAKKAPAAKKAASKRPAVKKAAAKKKP